MCNVSSWVKLSDAEWTLGSQVIEAVIVLIKLKLIDACILCGISTGCCVSSFKCVLRLKCCWLSIVPGLSEICDDDMVQAASLMYARMLVARAGSVRRGG